ncbi:MAG: hypothetical protein E2P02_13100 [Acidobacteria bacterium]|nr:MAG: hypothetical protein E2P02_13100 [Acidobacteriota bacterium]
MRSFAEIIELVGAKKSGANWLALCRAHDDRSPSLAVAEGDDGRTLFTCHAGCDTEAILSVYGLKWEDVLPAREKTRDKRTTWETRDIRGELVAEHIRIDTDGKKRFVWRRDGQSGLGGMKAAKLPLYRSEKISSFSNKKAVFLCEGEKATDAAAKLGLQSLGTVCGAHSIPGADALSVLADWDVILWPDFDDTGVSHMSRIAEVLDGVARSVRWLHIPGAKPKWDAADYRGTAEELRGCLRQGPPTIAGPLVMIGDRVSSDVRELERLHRGDFSDFVSTGLESLDRRLGGGLRRGQMILIGAPTGAGKTTLAVQFAIAAQERGLALVVSPEMSADELVTREIVRRSGKPKWHRSPWVGEHLRQEAEEAHQRAAEELRLQPPRVALMDSIDVRLEDVARAARAAQEQAPLSLIVLDYAQQLAGTDPKMARHLLVGEVGHRAVEMARDLNCPVVIMSQVNTVKDGREKDYSFRESQILEHKAHVVLLFVVDRDSQGRVERAVFRARKARDIALFELEVDFEPSTFSVRDLGAQQVQVRDWTAGIERDDDQWTSV